MTDTTPTPTTAYRYTISIDGSVWLETHEAALAAKTVEVADACGKYREVKVTDHLLGETTVTTFERRRSVRTEAYAA